MCAHGGIPSRTGRMRMKRLWFCLVLLVCPWSPVADTVHSSAPEPHRSPCDLAVLPDGHRALTANPTANSVSLVDLDKGVVLAEQACGQKPSGVACSPDGRRAAVSNLWSGTLTLLDIDETKLKPLATVAV